MASEEQLRVLNQILEVQREQLNLLNEIRDVIGSREAAYNTTTNDWQVVRLLDMAVSRLERIENQVGRG